LTFTGTQGEVLGLQIAGQGTAPAGNQVNYRVYKPSDRRISYYTKELTPTTGGVITMTLPETGTYWVWVDPDYGATTTAQLTLSTGTTSSLVQDGASANIETGLPGQTAYFRFNATAGQHLGFGVSDLVLSSGEYVRIYVYDPNGDAATGTNDSYCYANRGGCSIDIYNPMSGAYSVAVVPYGLEQAMQFKATLSSDATGTLTRDTPYGLNLDRRGQDGLLTFTGTQGEVLGLQIAGQGTAPAGNQVTYRVYKPSDRRISYYIKELTPTTSGVTTMTLPETGTYWIWADPGYGATSTAQITLDSTP
jgi:hypothetical protein